MKTSTRSLVLVLVLAAAGVCAAGGYHASPIKPSTTNSTLDALVDSATANIWAMLDARRTDPSATCTSKNVAVRMEWSKVPPAQKIEYIQAVKCLQRKAPITPQSVAPGVRSRFDDFAALHIKQTPRVHFTSQFYTWHRLFTHLYEKALREECGYTGYQPYWDWSSTTTLAAHPLFDGSATSLGGNGVPTVHTTSILIPTPNLINFTIPSGSGGGCITSGPFADMSVNLGPNGPPLVDGVSYNPRCLTRDFRDRVLSANLSYDRVAELVMQERLEAFDAVMTSGINLHGSGHAALGGEQVDFWGSPQDPSFHFHHGQVDRLYSLWQGLNQTVRTKEVIGTRTIMNQPPSAPGTLDTIVFMGFLGPAETIGELSSTIDGPFCYVYG
ncbi:hypothetical protein QTJ16_007098 [Diplocarpon rosae]|uniref:Tyrosinase copper-binding domain-containing protein n=1 Tax=Diplocarpon rosae TaxID=946125 RepID=A0AAD9SV73_9HELO|nr:hypothetical protein QTJ16_007098 [Diplocarpon rosae]PBP16155.1 hypothetical protein BUE80_DR013082 [Diplocarpon rosae]